MTIVKDIRMKKQNTVQIGKFKAECLHLLAEVSKSKMPLVVTKHQIPLVKIVPVDNELTPLFGCMKGLSEEFPCSDLRIAYELLGEITGDTTSEDVLNRIFERFCIGK